MNGTSRALWRTVIFAAIIIALPIHVACQSQTPLTSVSVQQQSTTPSHETESKPHVLTLNQALREALEANRRIRSANNLLGAATANVRQNEAKLYGELTASVSFQALNDRQLLRPLAGPVSPTAISQLPFAQYQLHSGVSYNYPLFVAGKLAYQIQISRLTAEIARVMLAETKADIVYNVTTLYVESVALHEQIKALEAELKELATTERHVRLSVTIGKIPGVDLLKVTDRIEETHAHLASVLSQRTHALSALSAMLGRDDSHGVIPGDLPHSLPAITVSSDQLFALASKSNPVLSTEAQAAQAQNSVNIARSSLMPQVQLQLNYFEHTNPGYPLNSQDTWSVGFQVSLPLFDGGERRAELESAKHKAIAAEEQAHQAKLEVRAHLDGALASWDAAQQQLTATDAQVKAADEVARIEQLRYDTGSGNIEDLLRARARQTAAQSSHIEALAAVFVAAAEINHVVSEEVVK